MGRRECEEEESEVWREQGSGRSGGAHGPGRLHGAQGPVLGPEGNGRCTCRAGAMASAPLLLSRMSHQHHPARAPGIHTRVSRLWDYGQAAASNIRGFFGGGGWFLFFSKY